MRNLQPVLAGLVSAVVGYASSFSVVLAGLQAVGADSRQAASGLLALCTGIAVSAAVLSVRYRMPVAIAWSTPGAALLVSAGQVTGGYPAAIGAFAVCGVLTVLAGLVPWLARGVAAIPGPIAAAMLAGVLVPLCTAPLRAMADVPLLAGPVILTWAVLMRYARQWAVAGALAAAVAGLAISGAAFPAASLRPDPVFTMPAVTLPALVGIALPLFLVTMAGQNVPGAAVLSTYGYSVPLRGALVTTGLVSTAAAPFGGHAVNLAAITAAMTAGPDAHPDPARRWVATLALGAGQLTLGLGAAFATALVVASPPVLVTAVAGLALLPALATSLATAFTGTDRREAAAVTFVVTASATSIAGIGSAFWGLIAGSLALLLTRRRTAPRPPEQPAAPTGPAPHAETSAARPA
ncbi:benzoate/H(+) symporter BenE family transporter [Microbispora amethystogenes]|uniref:Benzoate transporter n=1 Tax=Microbispora amethystogenes TaxID=1427754 RepID=A0ABQ4FIL8_9ACTN|nr:benzoate/H(+) symporter BenE family transporter [Microbispora amethystogenes]GIH34684.1 benzoate transporter [Microbispora amethystogenes]